MAPGIFADTILVNGKVVVMDAKKTIARAVAIKDSLIVQTGADAAIRALAGARTRTIDLRGRAVTPGLIDAHNHLSGVGSNELLYIDINPPKVKTIADLQAKIAEGVVRTPRSEWVLAYGYLAYDGRFPDKHDLDTVSPDQPVMLISQGGHTGAVNSYALKLAGVTARTPDPKFGMFVRDKQGEPNGTLINHAAMDVFRRIWAPKLDSSHVIEASTINPQAKFAAAGITTFGDVNVRGMTRLKGYFDVAKSRKMTIRGYLLNTIEYYQELAGRPEAVKAIRYEDDYMRFGGFKFLLDGAGIAAYTHEPHNGLAWKIATWDPKQLKEAVATLHKAGYQCAFHVIGDAAVDMALDAIEHAMKTHPRSDPRHRLEHAVMNTDSALRRTKDLGVVICTQPQGIRILGDLYAKIMGEKRAHRMIPTRSWLDLGVPLALSSDAPTMPWYQPQITLAAALARLSPSNRVIGADQRLTIEEAMYAHTMGGAYAIFQENIKGSLEPGKMADLAVWTADPYKATPKQLFDGTIDLTIVGGKIVHQA